MILRRAAAGDAELRLPGRATRPRRRVGLLPGGSAARGTERWVERLGLGRREEADPAPVGRAAPRRGQRSRPARRLRCSRPPRSPRPEIRARGRGARPTTSAAQMLAAMVGERANRRHRPGRGFEALRYRFEIVSDYGAFRDLQRHRMLTVPVAAARPRPRRRHPRGGARSGRRRRIRAGAGDLPGRVRAAAPPPGSTSSRPTRSASPSGSATTLDLNAREAMHLIELRSGREGHPTYRAVAQAMHEADRRRPPRRRRGDEVRRHLDRAAPRADDERDPHAPQARARSSSRARRPGLESARTADALVAPLALLARRRRPASGRPTRRRRVPAPRRAPALRCPRAAPRAERSSSSGSGPPSFGSSSSAIRSPGVGQGTASPAAQAGGLPPGNLPTRSRAK